MALMFKILILDTRGTVLVRMALHPMKESGHLPEYHYRDQVRQGLGF